MNNVVINVFKTTSKDFVNFALLCFCVVGGLSMVLGFGLMFMSFIKNLNIIKSVVKMVICSVCMFGGVISVTSAYFIVNS